MQSQHLANAPGMTHRAVGPDILIALINRMVGACQQEEIPTPFFSDVDKRHILAGPGIKLVKASGVSTVHSST